MHIRLHSGLVLVRVQGHEYFPSTGVPSFPAFNPQSVLPSPGGLTDIPISMVTFFPFALCPPGAHCARVPRYFYAESHYLPFFFDSPLVSCGFFSSDSPQNPTLEVFLGRGLKVPSSSHSRDLIFDFFTSMPLRNRSLFLLRVSLPTRFTTHRPF